MVPYICSIHQSSCRRVLFPAVALANALHHQLNPEIFYTSPFPPATCTSGLSTTPSFTLQNFPLSCLLITQSFYRQHLCFKLAEAPGADSSHSSGSFLLLRECWLFETRKLRRKLVCSDETTSLFGVVSILNDREHLDTGFPVDRQSCLRECCCFLLF